MNDVDIRPLLWEFVKQQIPDGHWIEEFNLGSCRADVVVISGDHLYALEIKGTNDTLSRLKKQVPAYEAIARYCSVVVASRWEGAIADKIPGHWGILIAEPRGVSEIRSPSPSPSQNPVSIAWEMWSQELRSFLKAQGIIKSLYVKGQRYSLAKKAKKLPPTVVEAEFARLIPQRIGKEGPYRCYRIADYDSYPGLK